MQFVGRSKMPGKMRYAKRAAHNLSSACMSIAIFFLMWTFVVPWIPLPTRVKMLIAQHVIVTDASNTASVHLNAGELARGSGLGQAFIELGVSSTGDRIRISTTSVPHSPEIAILGQNGLPIVAFTLDAVTRLPRIQLFEETHGSRLWSLTLDANGQPVITAP